MATYTWDHRNRLTDLRTYDDEDSLLTHVHYTYDARDLRIGKDVDATGSGAYTWGERYVYDVDDNLVLVYAVTYASGVPVAGSLATRQFSAATYDALFASESATGDMFWALTDHLGTVRDVTDADGDAVAHFTYQPVEQALFAMVRRRRGSGGWLGARGRFRAGWGFATGW